MRFNSLTYSTYRWGSRFLSLLVLVAIVLVPAPRAMAQLGSQSLREVRVIYPSEWGILNEGGLAYSARLREFFVLKQGKPNQGVSPGITIATFTPYEKAIDTLQLNYSVDNATNIAFDDQSSSLYILNSAPAELVRISVGSNGKLDPASLTRYNIASWDIKHADGIDIDAQTRQLFILDRKAYQLLSVALTESGPDSTSLSTTSLAHLQEAKVRGLAVNPANHHLYTASQSQRTLYELDSNGQVLSTYAFGSLDTVAPRDMVFAPSADLTDAESNLHLFVFDSRNVSDTGVQAGIKDAPEEIIDVLDANGYKVFIPMLSGGSRQEQNQPESNSVDVAAADKHFSRLIEIELRGADQVSAAAIAAIPLQLVRTIDTAAFSPPSPDPSGMAYLPNSNTILMSDGEVEETVSGITHFAGANVWELRLDGTVVRAANISKVSPTQTAMSNEPTGVTWNPNNGHYYVSDDDVPAWHDLNPGADQLIGTNDDSWVTRNTSSASNLDPEGIAYDPVNNYVYVVDGTNAEVYQYTTSGSLVNHFDVATYGVVDPESIEYNPYSGTLFVLSNWRSRIVIETTLNGALVETFDISAVTMKAPAGLTYAPASNGSGLQRFYIADRAVDNNDNPNEVDGKIYEMTAPQPTGSPTNTPTHTATNTPTHTPTATPTSTPVPPTNTPTNTPTHTPTATSTNTPIPPTATATHTATSTPTPIPPTATNTATNTPTATSTSTNTPTPIPPTATATDTSTDTPTPTATSTSTNTPTPIPPTATATDTSTDTPTPTATSTPIPPTATATDTATNTATATVTTTPVSSTATPTDTATDTPTPTATSTGEPPTDTPTPTPTPSATPGDINQDGNINIFDLQALINMIQHSPQPDAGLYPLDWWQRGDLLPDTQWNVFDLQLLINLIQNQ